jgi:hypothetical protein
LKDAEKLAWIGMRGAVSVPGELLADWLVKAGFGLEQKMHA